MQIRAAIAQTDIIYNIFGSIHDNVTKMVSRPMFSWSTIQMKALKKSLHEYIWPVCKLAVAITEKTTFINNFASIHHNVTKMVSRPMFLRSTIQMKALKKLSPEYILPVCKLVAAITEKNYFY